MSTSHASHTSERRTSTSLRFLPNTHILNLIMRRYEKNPKWGTLSKITGQYSSKTWRSWKREKAKKKKKDQRSEFIRLRSYNNSRQCGIPEPKKDATKQQALFHNVCRLVNNITAMLISWFWYSHCGYVKNICIRENLHFLQLSYKSKIIPRQKAFKKLK